MFELLERMREKSRGERQAMAFGIAAVVTGVIFILWTVSFFASLQPSNNEYKKEIGSLSESESSFHTFIASFQEARGTFKKEVEVAKEQFDVIRDGFEEAKEIYPQEGTAEIKTTLEKETEAEKETEVTPSRIEIIEVEE